MSSNKKSFFTPCRQVGLKRKSIGFTPPLPETEQINLQSTTKDDQTESPSPRISESFDQKESPSLCISEPFDQMESPSPCVSESLEQSSCSSPVSSLKLRYPYSKRLKSSIVRRIPVVLEPAQSLEVVPQVSSVNDLQVQSVPEVVFKLQEDPYYAESSLDDIKSQTELIEERISVKKAQIANQQSQSANSKQVLVYFNTNYTSQLCTIAK